MPYSNRTRPVVNANKLRNLYQYRNMPEDEFNDLMDKKAMDAAPVNEFERRIERFLEKFEEDYDLSEMKMNDKETLRALAQAHITLEDLEQYQYKLRKEGISLDNLTLIEKIGKQASELRSDASKMQEDLKITRKIRKGDKEESVIIFLEELKEKAKKFYESKMAYIFCPNCGMLLCTLWTQYPKENNKIRLSCGRELEDNTICQGKISITTEELLKNKQTNRQELLPESMR